MPKVNKIKNISKERKLKENDNKKLKQEKKKSNKNEKKESKKNKSIKNGENNVIENLNHLAENHTLEDEIFDKYPNCQYIVSTDECNRGGWAGDVVATAYAHSRDAKYIGGVKDSKKLKNKIAALYSKLSIVPNTFFSTVIDEINILQATFLCMKESVEHVINQLAKNRGLVSIPTDEVVVLIDGNKIPYDRDGRMHIFKTYKSQAIVKGDAKSYTIAAASILSKYKQIKDMEEIYHNLYPEYQFNKNHGYRNATHIEALKKYGITPIHRSSYNIKELGGKLSNLQPYKIKQ
jgi:ribonuclease HII